MSAPKPYVLTILPMVARSLTLVSALLLLAPAVALGQAPPASETADDAAQEGYLLAARLYAAPDAFAAEVPSISRDERVRVLPVPGEDGWFAVYREGAQQPAGYALHPYVSRFSASGLSEVRSAGGGVAADDPGLPEVVFAQSDEGALAVVNEWANVREGPSEQTRAFGVVRPGVPFRVVAVERGWGRVQLRGERATGYVSGRLLSRAPESAAPAPEAQPQEASAPSLAGEPAAAMPDGSETAEAITEADDETAEADLPPDQILVYVTRTGKRYHREDCTHLRAQRFALPLSKAADDYTPCRVCRPPRM